MAAKVLTYESCKRFYRIRDALADYAYGKLDIEEPLYINKGKMFGKENMYYEETLADTLDELWNTPAVLDEYIKKNPAALDTEDLAVIESWRNALHGLFVVFKHGDRLLFMRNKVLFEVTGLFDGIDNILKRPNYPILVETTLLPFEKKIVYHGFMKIMPASIAEGMREMLKSEFENALRDSGVITKSDDFITASPKIREAEIRDMAERMRYEADLAEKAKSQMKGFHRGILAGLSEPEREEAIATEMNKYLSNPESRKSLIGIIKKHVTKGVISRNLEKLLASEMKEQLQRWALVLGADVQGKGTKADLINALLPEMESNPFLYDLTLRAGLNRVQFDAYRRLYEAGGVFEIMENEIKTLKDIPTVLSVMCYSFFSKGSKNGNGKFTFVIPEDIMEVLGTLDWDEIREMIVCRETAADIVDAVVELRGVVKLDDAYEEFCRYHPSEMDKSNFENAIGDALAEDRISCGLLEADDGNNYLIHYEIAGYYKEATDPEYEDGKEYTGFEDYFMRGPLEPLKFIIDQQKGKRARPLEDNMLSSMAVFDWKCAKPAVQAMREYLDENVPDSQNDYYYADAVIEALIDYMVFGVMNGGSTVNEWIEIMAEHGYEPNEAHLHRVINLLMNMHNSLPNWMNNGWAPEEIADVMYGRKAFYNEDGSKMKVGRNDLCPCGSGKKYKACCGRN